MTLGSDPIRPGLLDLNAFQKNCNYAPKSQYGFTCGDKRTCGQTLSCEEAKFYLNQCGLLRLDGDKDGTPCESLCE
jgi:hypothetical protein